MAEHDFDQRYPAMFQPGGEALLSDASWLAPQELERPEPMGSVVPWPATPVPRVEAENEVESVIDTRSDAEADVERAGSNPDGVVRKVPLLLWFSPAVLGALLVVAGLTAPAIPLWADIFKPDPLTPQMRSLWSFEAAQWAAPVLGTGLGILGLLLFVVVQQNAVRRGWLRHVFTVAALAILTFGLLSQFGALLVAPIRYETVEGASGVESYYLSPPGFVSMLAMMSFGPLLVGILMLAVQVVSRNFSLVRSYAMGLFLLAAAFFTQYAQFLFPDVPPTSQIFDGGNRSIPGWPQWLPELTPVLVAAGVLVLAAAAMWPLCRTLMRKMTTGTTNTHVEPEVTDYVESGV